LEVPGNEICEERKEEIVEYAIVEKGRQHPKDQEDLTMLSPRKI